MRSPPTLPDCSANSPNIRPAGVPNRADDRDLPPVPHSDFDSFRGDAARTLDSAAFGRVDAVYTAALHRARLPRPSTLSSTPIVNRVACDSPARRTSCPLRSTVVLRDFSVAALDSRFKPERSSATPIFSI